MYNLISQCLFWFYWAMIAVIAGLTLRELLRGTDWRYQATAGLALIPLILRVFLLK